MTGGPVRTAVLPVAGLGTRFLPATKAVPKELLPVFGRPLVHYAVEEALAAGIERCVLVTAPGRGLALDYFRPDPALERALRERGNADALRLVEEVAARADAVAAVEQPEPLGLGDAVRRAAAEVGEAPCAVLLPDDLVLAGTPCIAQLLEAHARLGGTVVGVAEVAPEETGKFGIVDPGSDDGSVVEVRGLVEKPPPGRAPSRLGVVGRYVLAPAVLAALADVAPGAGGEIQLTDAIAATIGREPVHGLRFRGRRFDCGSRVGAVEAEVAVALADPEFADGVRAALARAGGAAG